MMTDAAQVPPSSALKILICYHRPYTMPPDDGVLLPIHAGKALSTLNLNMQGDNEVNGQPCDNISDKNWCYCELTAIYWAWKNLRKLYPDVKYVGLFHYRRFFAFNERALFYECIDKPEEDIANYHIDHEQLMKSLAAYDIIIGHKVIGPYAQYISFSLAEIACEEYRIMKDIIHNDFPDYYDAFIEFWENNNKCSLKNMFVMKWEDFDNYCEWMFAFLTTFEKKMNTLRTPEYMSRYIGYIAERMLNVYVLKHKMKARYCNIYSYQLKLSEMKPESMLTKFRHSMKEFARAFRNELIFRLIQLTRLKKSPSKP